MIYHVCKKEVWEKEKRNSSFGEEELKNYGFIHSSVKKGLSKIISRFKETEEYVVLTIDEEKIRDLIFYEEKDSEHLYPHFREKIDRSLIVKEEGLNAFLSRNPLKEEWYIFTDVDGTLYDYEMNLPQSTKEAIRKLKENGHHIYLATGRSKAEIPDELNELAFDGMILGNGAYIEEHGNIIHHHHLSEQDCARIVNWCEKKELGFYEESNSGLFGSERFFEKDGAQALLRYMYGKGFSFEELEDFDPLSLLHGLVRGGELYRDDVNKISFVLHSYEDYLEAKEEFKDLHVSTWGGIGETALFGDAGIAESDKAQGIAILLEALHPDKVNTMAIGDAGADIPMLEYCKVGVAMGSCSMDVADAADYVTDDVDKDGFYKAMKHFALI